MLTFSFQPYEGTDETKKTEIGFGQLVKPGKDSAIMFNFADETLHKVTLSVKVFVVLSGHFTI